MAFTPSASKKHRKKDDGELNMNSMMDMITIILLFLLKSYSTEAIVAAKSADLTMPKSMTLSKPEQKPTVEVSKSKITFNDEIIVTRENIGDKLLIDPLYTALKSNADDQKKIEQYGLVFDHRVLLVIDEDVSFDLLVKIMNTCSRAGYWEIRMMVFGGENDLS